MVTPWEDLAGHPPTAFFNRILFNRWCSLQQISASSSVRGEPFGKLKTGLSNHPSAERPFGKLRANGGVHYSHNG
jgi:hypothetical protein